MKKVILIFLSVLLIGSLAGCNVPSKHSADLTELGTPELTTSATISSPSAIPTATITPEPTVTATPTSTIPPTLTPTPVPTTKPTAKPTTKPTAKPTQKSSGATVVQMADPETGISWDGKSPIIYTYSDGTTGTEKRVGATYEQVPGVINTIIASDIASPSPSAITSTCRHCGKVRGNGTNGTCVRYSMLSKDMICSNCGENIPARTCHTCQ